MVTTNVASELEGEEELVADLERLGIRYLSRVNKNTPHKMHLPSRLIAELSQQRSSRVRAALISLLLAHPEYAKFVPAAIRLTTARQTILIKIFYTAAVFLQKKYAHLFREQRELPDLYSHDLGISGSSTEEKLSHLGKKHQDVSGQQINWRGSYENAAKHLFRQWEMEEKWNKLQGKP